MSSALQISFCHTFNFFKLVDQFGNPSSYFGESSQHIPPIIVEWDSHTRLFASAGVDGFWKVGALQIGHINRLDQNYAIFHKCEGLHYLE